MEARDVLLILAEKYQGDWEKMYVAIRDKEDVSGIQGQRLLDRLTNKCAATNTKYVTLLDEDYPSFLSKTQKPPFVLFYDGDLSLVNQKEEGRIYVAGSGDTLSDFGKRAAVKIAMDIAKEGQHTLVTTDVSAAEIAIQKVAHLLPGTPMKTVLVTQSAVNNTGKNRVLANNIVLGGGLVMSTIPVGSAAEEKKAATQLASNLGSGNIIVVELGGTSGKQFLEDAGINTLLIRYGYAVIHDITLATADGCHELVTESVFEPYLGDLHIY